MIVQFRNWNNIPHGRKKSLMDKLNSYVIDGAILGASYVQPLES